LISFVEFVQPQQHLLWNARHNDDPKLRKVGQVCWSKLNTEQDM